MPGCLPAPVLVPSKCTKSKACCSIELPASIDGWFVAPTQPHFVLANSGLCRKCGAFPLYTESPSLGLNKLAAYCRKAVGTCRCRDTRHTLKTSVWNDRLLHIQYVVCLRISILFRPTYLRYLLRTAYTLPRTWPFFPTNRKPSTKACWLSRSDQPQYTHTQLGLCYFFFFFPEAPLLQRRLSIFIHDLQLLIGCKMSTSAN